MAKCQRSQSGWLVVGLLLLSSTLAMVQLGTPTPSFGQNVAQTTYSPGIPTTWYTHTGNRTGHWTHTWTGSPAWDHTGNQSWAWTHTGNQSWTPPGNRTAHEKRQAPPVLLNGWAHSNITVAARNLTQPILMNGTQGVRLGFIMINESSSNQIIRKVAINETVAQIEFDHNGSIQLIINSSVKPSQVLADNTVLAEAQSLNNLSFWRQAWFYDPNNYTLTIFADPASVTLVYGLAQSTPTPVPEYMTTIPQVLIGCLTITLLIGKRSRNRKAMPAASHLG